MKHLLASKKRSIAGELTICLFFLVIVIECILFAFIYTKQVSIQGQELEDKAKDYSDNLGKVLAVPIWDYDDEQIEKIGTVFADNDFIDEIKISDIESQLIYSYQDKSSSRARIKKSVTIMHLIISR